MVLSDFAPAQSQDRSVPTSVTVAAAAHQAMIEIFRRKDPSAVDRFFAEPFAQHDPTIADGLPGMKLFVAEVASSPAADITISFRHVVTVQLHLERVGEFIDDNYIQHASGFGDGIARFKSRVLDVAKPAAVPVLKLTRRKP